MSHRCAIRRTLTPLVVAVAAVVAAPGVCAAAGHHSLYAGPGPRPGPALLYRAPITPAPLTNTGVWKAPPILVSGASAYRDGEFLYQDYLYDDHGAHGLADLTNPQSAQGSDLFSMPNGTYTYPTGPGYDNNAADLVELRVKPLRAATAFRITLNTLANPNLIAFSIAIGGSAGHPVPFPFGANVRAPADLFLTVHPAGGRLIGVLTRAAGGAVSGAAPVVRVDLGRHQIEVTVPHSDWNPGRATVRLAAGVGLWDGAGNRYLAPQLIADASHPGGAPILGSPAAFFNVAFRSREPFPSVTAGVGAVLDAAWWRDAAQARALAGGDISSLSTEVSFAKLARRAHDDSAIPRTGGFDRIVGSRFSLGQGASYAHVCGLAGAGSATACSPEYLGQLQPYAIYVPAGAPARAGYGMTLLLHSLSANYNQFLGSRNQAQFANRSTPSVVITPEALGPDQFYERYGAADVFEVWADVARRYRLDPSYADIAGYSMGGIGTFKLGAQYPDLFARAQPTVGDETDADVLASLRNLPVLMWNNVADELVNVTLFTSTAEALNRLGYRYELDAFQPCLNLKCSPLFSNHLELTINDQFAPAAAFLGAVKVDRNPAHVTYVLDAARNRPDLGLNGDHAYWVSAIKLRNPARKGPGGDPEGEIDAVSRGFGATDPRPQPEPGGTLGTLPGGNMGTLTFARSGQVWGASSRVARGDEIDIGASNVAAASINTKRAHVDCRVRIVVRRTDGPIAISLPGCRRVVEAG